MARGKEPLVRGLPFWGKIFWGTPSSWKVGPLEFSPRGVLGPVREHWCCVPLQGGSSGAL